MLLNSLTPKGKGIMVDDAAAPSVGASRPRPSSGPAPSFRDVSCDAIHTNFFSFFVGPYYATYPKGGVAGNCEFTREEWDAPYRPTFRVPTKEVFKDLAVCKTIVDQFPTPREMVQVESLSDDQLTAKMSVLHYMMMSLKGYEEKVASLTGLELQVSTLKKQVSGLNDKLVSFDASFAKSKAKGKERKKKIKSLTKSLDNLHAEVARLSANLNRATVLEAEKDEEILRLNATPLDAGFERRLSMHQTKDEFADVLKKMANFMPVSTPRDARVSPPIIKKTTATPASKSLELSTNVVPASSAVAFEQNEERVNVVVDGLDLEMTGGAAPSKSGSVFVQGTSHILDDFVEVAAVGSERVSSGPTDVVVALSVGEKEAMRMVDRVKRATISLGMMRMGGGHGYQRKFTRSARLQRSDSTSITLIIAWSIGERDTMHEEIVVCWRMKSHGRQQTCSVDGGGLMITTRGNMHAVGNSRRDVSNFLVCDVRIWLGLTVLAKVFYGCEEAGEVRIDVEVDLLREPLIMGEKDVRGRTCVHRRERFSTGVQDVKRSNDLMEALSLHRTCESVRLGVDGVEHNAHCQLWRSIRGECRMWRNSGWGVDGAVGDMIC
ncbi:hypothetical protein Tco_1205693 [Tanacetum coccineum]